DPILNPVKGSAPGLLPLGNYGGPTQTIRLAANSPAIGAGDPALVPDGVTTDQRGEPRISGTGLDIGAFEYQYPVLSPAKLPGGTYGTPYTQSLTATGDGVAFALPLTAGTLPYGLSLDPNSGALTGTPTAVGTFNFTVSAFDAFGFNGSQAYSVNITPAML